MKLIIYITLLVAVLATTSCRLLRKDNLSTKTQSELETLQLDLQKTTRTDQTQLVLFDSSENNFTTIVWPKGNFKLSTTGAFEGEAEKIIMKGKNTHKQLLNLQQETKQDSITLKADYISTKEKSAIVERKKFSINSAWSWLLVIPILYVGYWLYRIREGVRA